MERRQIGAIAIAVGVAAMLLAVLADPLGIGGTEGKFGWKQVILLVGGLLIAAYGLVALKRRGPEAQSGGVDEPAGGAGEP